MTPETGRAGPGDRPRTGPKTPSSNTSRRQAADVIEVTSSNRALTRAGVLVLVGKRFAPDQNRRQDLIVVLCRCGYEHAHRGTGIRRAPCGAEYVVAVAE